MTRRRHDEAGMTLVEILIVIVIMGVITAAIGAVLIVSIQNTERTRTRMSQSRHSNLITTYLNPDVASAETAVADTGTLCSGGTNELQLQWTETRPFGNGLPPTVTNYVAAYRVVNSGGEFLLKRWYCEGGTVVNEKTVARELSGAGAVSATVSGTAISLTVNQTQGRDTLNFTVGGTAGSRI